MVLEALDIEVMVEGKRVTMRGFLPISARRVSPAPPLPRLRRPRGKQPTIAFELAAVLA